MAEAPLEIDVQTLATWRADGAALTLLDVREKWETDLCCVKGAVTIPLGQIETRYKELPQSGRIAVMCHHGGRSMRAVQALRQKGIMATNVKGGIHEWACCIDPAMPKYE